MESLEEERHHSSSTQLPFHYPSKLSKCDTFMMVKLVQQILIFLCRILGEICQDATESE